MRLNLDNDDNFKENLETADELKAKLAKQQKKIFKAHYKRLEKGVYSTRAGVIFMDYVNRTERIGEYVFSINEKIQKLL